MIRMPAEGEELYGAEEGGSAPVALTTPPAP